MPLKISVIETTHKTSALENKIWGSGGRELQIEPVLQGKHIDTLVCLVEYGPCWCGDVPSKSARDDLIEWGYAIHTMVKGEQGFSAITPAGVEEYTKRFGGDTVTQAIRNRKAALAALGD